MISLEKLKNLTALQNFPKNVVDLDKLNPISPNLVTMLAADV